MRRKIAGTEALVELVNGRIVYHNGGLCYLDPTENTDVDFLIITPRGCCHPKTVLIWTDCEVDDPSYVAPDKVAEALLAGKTIRESPINKHYGVDALFRLSPVLWVKEGGREWRATQSSHEAFSSSSRTDGYEYRIVEDT